MSQAQAGILDSPGKHRLLLILTIEDMPLTAMSIAKIGAMTPQLCSEVNSKRPEAQLKAMVGFGPQLWSLILLDSHSTAFRALKPTNEAPYTGGDFLLYFSSNSIEFNRELAKNVVEYTQSMTESSEQIEGTVCTVQDTEIVDEKEIFLGNRNPELDQSSFAYIRCWQGEQEKLGRPGSPITLDHLLENPEASERCSIQFSSNPFVFQDCARDLKWGQPITGSTFMLPSLDLLTGLRMGGLRMGSLSPTAIWKSL
jgi:porphyrinogen peroxidase